MKLNLKLMSLFIAVAALASCSSEDDVIDDTKSDAWYSTPLDSDQSFFANIAIISAGANTRADDEYDATEEPEFDKGTNTENEVKTIFFIFYDKNGKRVATTQVRKDNGKESDGRNESENKIYSGVVQIDVKHGSLKPAYVMAFINPITSTNFEINPEFETMTSLEAATRPRIIDDNGQFAMSKSVYYGKNRVTGAETPEKIVATPLPEEKLFSSEGEAKAALEKGNREEGWSGDDTGIVDIYVERYAAKVNFSFNESNLQNGNVATYSIKVDNYTLKFVPEYWAVNAYESNTYIVKSFLGSDNKTMTYNFLDNILTDSGKSPWFWNSQDHHRSYWAQSPAYYSENYPRVADDINDGVYNGGEWIDQDYVLGYYSYNDMKKNADGTLIAKARKISETKQMIYARENTVSGASLQAAYGDATASPKAAIASVVLVGHYEFEGKAYEENKTFYVMGNATNGYTLFEDTESMLPYFVNNTIQFAKDEFGEPFFNYSLDGGEFLKADEENYKKYFKVEHPSKEARKNVVLDSRFVTIQLNKDEVLKQENQEGNPLFAYLNGKYKQVTADNIDEINEQMFYAAGTVQAFQGGKAYFTIPIKHLGFYRANNPNAGKNANDKTFNWNAVQSGDFGLVRNHTYSIVVDKIEGLGNGIPNPNDPIVPPTDPEEYFIGARIIVLNWAIVPEQHVTL